MKFDASLFTPFFHLSSGSTHSPQALQRSKTIGQGMAEIATNIKWPPSLQSLEQRIAGSIQKMSAVLELGLFVGAVLGIFILLVFNSILLFNSGFRDTATVQEYTGQPQIYLSSSYYSSSWRSPSPSISPRLYP